MIRIAIVDDEREAIEKLQTMIERFGEETDTEMDVLPFVDVLSFLNNYQANFDIVFMDIEMPDVNGLKAAELIREKDHSTLLIFETNMGQMAAMGYAVEAFDFIVKPFSYETFRSKMNRVRHHLDRNRESNVAFQSNGARIAMTAREIRYLEVNNHSLIFHTESGNYPTYGTLAEWRERLEPLGFASCNSCYLVNLRYVRKIEKFTVTVGSEELQISRPRKKSFLQALNQYIGG